MNPRTHRAPIAARSARSFAIIICATAAIAQAQTWDGGGGNNNYSNAANWNPNALPANNGTANIIFAGAVRPTPVLDSNQSVATVTFNSATAFSLSSSNSSILSVGVLGGGGNLINVTGSGAATISNDVTLGSGTVTATGANLTLSGRVNIGTNSTVTFTPGTGRTITFGSFNNALAVLNNSVTRIVGPGEVIVAANGAASYFSSARVEVVGGTLTGTGQTTLPNVTVSASGLLKHPGFAFTTGDLRVSGGTVEFTGALAGVGNLLNDVVISTGHIKGVPTTFGNGMLKVEVSPSAPVISAVLDVGTIDVAASSMRSVDVIFQSPLAGQVTLLSGDMGFSHFTATATNSTLNRLLVTGANANVFADASPVSPTGTVALTGSNQFLSSRESGTTINYVEVSGNGAGLGLFLPTLTLNSVRILSNASATVAVSSLNVGTLTIDSGATYDLGFSAPHTTINNSGVFNSKVTGTAINTFNNNVGGVVNMTGGMTASTLNNFGTLNLTGFEFIGTINHVSGIINLPSGGIATITGKLNLNGGSFSAGSLQVSGSAGQLAINTPLAVPIDLSLRSVASVNNSSLTMAGGAFGATSFTNLGAVAGNGTFLAGVYTNAATWTVNGLQLFDVNSTLRNTTGTLSVPLNSQIVLIGNGSVQNLGVLSLASGKISGGFVSNSATGLLTGRGQISSVVNNVSGTILPDGGILFLDGPVANGGIIRVTPTAPLGGTGVITNTGRIQGDGTIANAITNASGGRIEPKGTLQLISPLTLSTGSQIQATFGNTLVLQGGLSGSNSGSILLSGGAVDSGLNAVTNGASGQIAGWGNLNTASLRNSGAMTFTGGSSLISGPVTNDLSKSIKVQAGTAIFTSQVTNNGAIQVISGEAVFTGGLTGNPAGAGPLSSPAFSNSVVGGGSLSVAAGAAVLVDGVSQASVSIAGTSVSPGYLTVQTHQPEGFTPVTGRTVMPSTSVVGTLSITKIGSAYQGMLDLQDNNMVVTGMTEGALRDMVAAWWNKGSRDGLGLGSSFSTTGFAVGNLDQLATLAVVGNSNGAGGVRRSDLDGVPVSAGDVLVKYTYIGDADLNGKVDTQDLAQLLTGLRGGLSGWWNGDNNYDGLVNGDDLANLLTVMRLQGAAFSGGSIGSGGGGGSVPEPASATLLVVGALALTRRRSRVR